MICACQFSSVRPNFKNTIKFRKSCQKSKVVSLSGQKTLESLASFASLFSSVHGSPLSFISAQGNSTMRTAQPTGSISAWFVFNTFHIAFSLHNIFLPEQASRFLCWVLLNSSQLPFHITFLQCKNIYQ